MFNLILRHLRGYRHKVARRADRAKVALRRAPSSCGAVAGTLHDTKKTCPRTDSLAVLDGHDARDLVEMVEIVGRPGGQQLRQCDLAELRVVTAPL
jgi:hypothetical protein